MGWIGPTESFMRNYKAQEEELKLCLFALRQIVNYGGFVCEDYENCTHRACMASYNCWAIARITLDKLEKIEKGE